MFSVRDGLVLLAIGAGGLMPAAAWACRCPPQSAASAYRGADAVVLGRVVGSRDVDRYRRIYTIEVQRGWKRTLGKRAEVATRRTTCQADFASGETHLIYVSLPSDGGMAETTACSGNRSGAQVTSGLAWLSRHGRPAGPR